jgi:hypothetical protein
MGCGYLCILSIQIFKERVESGPALLAFSRKGEADLAVWQNELFLARITANQRMQADAGCARAADVNRSPKEMNEDYL